MFGSKTPAHPPRDVAAMAAHLAQPAVQIIAGLPVRSGEPVHSWFLGEPDLAPGADWPTREGRRIDHILTLDLAEAQALVPVDWLPASGSLAVFYDQKKGPYGKASQRDGWRTLYRPERATSRSPDSRRLELKAFRSYVDAEGLRADALDLNDEEWDIYCGLEMAQTGVEYCHQFVGHAATIQGPALEQECEAESTGIKIEDAGKSDWRLLLQVSTDESIDFMFGDAGNVYYMIRERDARTARFDDVWLIGDCF
ncbi:MAG TPA: YwqG family protein [Steroidobacteraceae bacterium]|nr:YwqG family protein [Steroidobacteraceae bacterium]